jgi:alpha-beta hydrolase superfamily lysophospholipase
LTSKRKWIKKVLYGFAVLVFIINVMAIFHAYQFTHFTRIPNGKMQDPKYLSLTQKVKMLFLGAKIPRPENTLVPAKTFKTITLQSNKKISCWLVHTPKAKGTVILFHGYGGNKSRMLDKASVFQSLGYHTLLVDFMGAGASEGEQTSIGYYEAQQVKTCYDFIAAEGERNIVLFGTSMGAVSIMKAIHDYQLSPQKIILECPFGTMYQTVCARFNNMKTPTFPMAACLVFWGGVLNGFWAFDHNPVEYAKNIHCPTLLLYGAKDDKVSAAEIDEIYNRLKGSKQLRIYTNAAHENYLIRYKKEWTKDVGLFLATSQNLGASK